MTGRAVIVSGPSGVGKDTVLDLWMARDPRVRRVVAATSRAPRPGETPGEDYLFLNREEFLARAARGEFLEWKEVHGNLYGTPLAHLEALLARGGIAILKIDVQGAAEVFEKRPDVLGIFLLPPSFEELERRIRARGTDSEEAIGRRLANARDELAYAPRYAHRVVNVDVAATVEELARLTA